MSTSKGYLDFILEQLAPLQEVTHRAMMGEYILYYRGRIAAYLCDDRLLVKPVAAARALLPQAPMEPPYPGAKDMLVVEDVDNSAFLTELFEAMYPQLPQPKAKAAKSGAPKAKTLKGETAKSAVANGGTSKAAAAKGKEKPKMP